MNSSKPLIIVVEDDYLIALDLKEILESEGYSVISEINSIEHAIELIKKLNPVLVIIDVNLKMDKDGIYIGNFLLELDKIPYIYVTSYSDTLTINRIKETRPFGFIKKPFNPIDIITNVNIVLNNYKHNKIDVVRNNKKEEITDESPFIIKKTIQYINSHIYETIEIEQLVSLTRWKKHHFSRMFIKYIGVTPYQYILNQKIELSKSLLIETNNQIVDIAYELGFNNHSNFSTRFKKITGKSPEDFRKINNIKKDYNLF
jgi:AraC-like DNA-binding protein